MIIKIDEREYENLVRIIDKWVEGYKREDDGSEIYSYDFADDILMELGIEKE